MRASVRWLLALGLLLAAPPALAAERAAIHAAPDRLEFVFPGWTGWWMHRGGDRVRLRFSRKLPFAPTPALPPWVRGFRDGPGWARLEVAPGTKLHRQRNVGRLTLKAEGAAVGRAPVLSRRDGPDRPPPLAPVADRHARGAKPEGPASGVPSLPPGSGAQAASAKPSASTRAAAPQASAAPPQAPASAGSVPPAQARTSGGGIASPAAAAAEAPAPAGTAVATPLFPGPKPAGPVALAAQAEPSGGGAPKAILVPFEPGVGASAFRRGDRALVVFDAARPIDVAALRGTAVFGGARVRPLASGTEMVLRLPRDKRLALRRRAAGWEIRLIGAARPQPPAIIRPRAGAGTMRLAAPDPGGVVSLLDPLTGLPLLVGTERGNGARLPLGRRAPQFLLLRSWQGAVALALSDRLGMAAEHGGFRLSLAGGALAVSPGGPDAAALADAALLTRHFDFPDLPRAALAARMRRELRAAAGLPPLARGKALRRAARSMIALGMAAEAGGVLRLAAAGDPREASSATHAGLAAIAALLAHRSGEARGIADPRLSGSDEVDLWRAARAA
ncbi:MAG: hypothetical protein KGI51_14225, partial [Rhodospirillales bacterium]|nr:hypothetical protein [Rhodospirillales bacterium]